MKKLPPKTKKEAAQRLIDGERFMLRRNVIFYDDSIGVDPFCYILEARPPKPIGDLWESACHWQPIQEWHETVSPENPRLCWITQRKDCASLITGYDKRIYYASTGSGHRFATPVLPEDLTCG